MEKITPHEIDALVADQSKAELLYFVKTQLLHAMNAIAVSLNKNFDQPELIHYIKELHKLVHGPEGVAKKHWEAQ
jgi:hypothetical protein